MNHEPENNQRPVLGFHDIDGLLQQWFRDDCQRWTLRFGDELFCQQGTYVLWDEAGRVVGALAREVNPEVAAELLLGSGYELPAGLLCFISTDKFDNPKNETRSKPRRPPRRPKGSHGLGEFASSQRTRDSRGPNG